MGFIYGSRGHCQPLWKEFPLLKKYCFVFSQSLLTEHHLLLLHWCVQLLVSLWHWWAALITCPTRQGALRSVPLPLFAGIKCDNDSGAEICLRCLRAKRWGKSAELWSQWHKAEDHAMPTDFHTRVPSWGFWTEHWGYIWAQSCILYKQPCWPGATEQVLTLQSSAFWMLELLLQYFINGSFKI